jgi:AcrR family transcriptional regulator
MEAAIPARALVKRVQPAVEPESSAALTPRRAQTRQALLDAAAALFAERGYHEVGVPDIVRAAGVSQGTFYQYFGHRRDVLVALAQLAHEAAAARSPIQHVKETADFAERLRAEIGAYLIESLRHRALAKVWHDASAYDQEIAGMTRRARAARADQLSAVIQSLDCASDLDADVAATAIVAMIEEFSYRWCVERGGPVRNADDLRSASHTLSKLVTRALGLDNGPRAANRRP